MSKIIHIIPSLKIGGAEKFLVDIFPYLKKNDHKICPFVFTQQLSSAHLNLDGKYSRFWKYIYQSDNTSAKLFKPLLFVYYCLRASKIISNECSTTFITYTAQGSIAFYLVKKILAKKHIKWACRVGSDLDAKSDIPPLFRRKIIHPFFNYFHNKLFKKILHDADIVISTSRKLKIKLQSTYILNEEKIKVVPNCVAKVITNLNNYTSSPSIIVDFISAGRLEYKKGFDFLIKSFAEFHKLYPQNKLHIFGDGSQKKNLIKLVAELNLTNHVFLLGFIENPCQYLKSASAFIVPSRSEGFCRIIVEAMAAKHIILSSNCNFGPSEIISDGYDGFLFDSEDTHSLLAKMNEIIQLPDHIRKTMQERAAQKAKSYEADSIANHFESNLNNLLS